jgi:hypothetical protein
LLRGCAAGVATHIINQIRAFTRERGIAVRQGIGPAQPRPRRMRAAEAALPFVQLSPPTSHSFGAQMEELARQRGKSSVIDAEVNYRPLPDPSNSGVTDPTGDVG